ncbi:hypothetical protein [Rhizobium ruizarguesonis]|uniref:Uncharacterized protein n=1 Tax=Rhizobium ruizarguesonis TaxID=2081791 RepID=A0AAE8Q9W9_9HYPH|nr:hypothetical protein [Rhizobium ruizarguesonis]TBD78489.1 hypothetical protein ELH11_00485 [Rhizobium ruizarguesonis]TBE09646.1 hypothetical protein ELH09_00485 [Rhizobium ruizarguesonis]TBF16962.1 hypothetical protein ELG94_00485 [Rhizobium ruizarguesonis]
MLPSIRLHQDFPKAWSRKALPRDQDFPDPLGRKGMINAGQDEPERRIQIADFVRTFFHSLIEAPGRSRIAFQGYRQRVGLLLRFQCGKEFCHGFPNGSVSCLNLRHRAPGAFSAWLLEIERCGDVARFARHEPVYASCCPARPGIWHPLEVLR